MAVNSYNFNLDRQILSGATESIILTKSPFSAVGLIYRGLFCDLNLCISGNSYSHLVFEKWTFAWRYSASNTLSSAANDLREIRVSTMGINIPTSVTAGLSMGEPMITIVMSSPSGVNFCCTGTVWTTTV
jgi:hypothetical protein